MGAGGAIISASLPVFGLLFNVLTSYPPGTSSRKMQLYADREILGQLLRVLMSPRQSLFNKKSVSMWYDGALKKRLNNIKQR